MLGAGHWVGLIFTAHQHTAVSMECQTNDFQFSAYVIDACCLYGIQAAMLIGVELLRRSERHLLATTETEHLLSVVRQAEVDAGASEIVLQSVVASALTNHPVRCVALL
eukprot:COSAG02_NODE_43018_length_379_cov_0.503571_1_plen_108_part_01